MPDTHGHYTGEDFERRVYAILRYGTLVSAGAISQRTGVVDTSQVEEALNAQLRELWAEMADRVPERIVRLHDFTYPAGAERLALRATAPSGARVMSPALPGPPLDFWRLDDRRYDDDMPPLVRVDMDEYWRQNGPRWTLHAGCLYFSDQEMRRGPTTDWDMRLHWLPQARPIQRTSREAREDIPLELHEALCLGAAARLMVEIGDERAGALRAQYQLDHDKAIRSVGRHDRQPRYIRFTRPALAADPLRRGRLRGIAR